MLDIPAGSGAMQRLDFAMAGCRPDERARCCSAATVMLFDRLTRLPGRPVARHHVRQPWIMPQQLGGSK
jgi:hypothetical protein